MAVFRAITNEFLNERCNRRASSCGSESQALRASGVSWPNGRQIPTSDGSLLLRGQH